jgi:hypothetical protein
MTAEPTASQRRAALGEYVRLIAGSALASLLGAFLGLLVPGDGNPARISLICLTAFCGWLFWVRRRRSVWVTIVICAALWSSATRSR